MGPFIDLWLSITKECKPNFGMLQTLALQSLTLSNSKTQFCKEVLEKIVGIAEPQDLGDDVS